jgi:hypothetical protein
MTKEKETRQIITEEIIEKGVKMIVDDETIRMINDDTENHLNTRIKKRKRCDEDAWEYKIILYRKNLYSEEIEIRMSMSLETRDVLPLSQVVEYRKKSFYRFCVMYQGQYLTIKISSPNQSSFSEINVEVDEEIMTEMSCNLQTFRFVIECLFSLFRWMIEERGEFCYDAINFYKLIALYYSERMIDVQIPTRRKHTNHNNISYIIQVYKQRV